MRILVTGGAGYIGSVVTERLAETGHEVVALDNLMYGHRAAVVPWAAFVEADLMQPHRVLDVMKSEKFSAVVHLAAESVVSKSVADPEVFFKTNVQGGLNLLDCMRKTGVELIVFSSTAAVYGEPDRTPIEEDDLTRPINPYGLSKLQFEQILSWYGSAYGLRSISLRYFNASGASSRNGEHRKLETHLIPILLDVALGIRPFIQLFGDDYPTRDGTCIRDYVHVCDIADAHILALRHAQSNVSISYNIGSELGYSNLEVIDAVRRVTGRLIDVRLAPRREGDPATLVASSKRIRADLGWASPHSTLDEIVESAWRWRLDHPNGYDA